MNLGRVTGRLWATIKAPGLEGVRLLLLQPLDETLAPQGSPLVACDAVRAGPGELVHWIGGREAALALRETFVPVDATITGHVEQVAARG